MVMNPIYPMVPWEPKTFIFRGYNPYVHFWGVKPSCFMVLVSKGMK